MREKEIHKILWDFLPYKRIPEYRPKDLIKS